MRKIKLGTVTEAMMEPIISDGLRKRNRLMNFTILKGVCFSSRELVYLRHELKLFEMLNCIQNKNSK